MESVQNLRKNAFNHLWKTGGASKELFGGDKERLA